MKKYIILAVAAAVILIAAICGYNSYESSKYERNRKEFITQASEAMGLYITLCEDIRHVWYNYIFEKKIYFIPATGEFKSASDRFYVDDDEVWCQNFSDAIQKRIEWQSKKISPEMREPFTEAKRLYKAMTPPPSEFEETHGYVKQMFKSMDKLKELAENPTGNYREYATNCNQCVEAYTSALKDLEIEAEIK